MVWINRTGRNEAIEPKKKPMVSERRHCMASKAMMVDSVRAYILQLRSGRSNRQIKLRTVEAMAIRLP